MKKKIATFSVIILVLSILFLTACQAQNKNKNESKNNLPSKTDEYDAIIASGDGFNIVMKHEDTFERAYDTVGVINDAGEWIHFLSEEHPFIKNGEIVKEVNSVFANLDGSVPEASIKDSIRIRDIRSCIKYNGMGMFLLCYARNGNNVKNFILFNAETGEGWDIGARYGMTEFNDGYSISCTDGKMDAPVSIIDTNGNITNTGISTRYGSGIGKYAEGVFWGGRNFYTIDGRIAINLSKYDIVNIPYFEDSKCYIEIKNNGGVVYKTEINHEGKFLYEPVVKSD